MSGEKKPAWRRLGQRTEGLFLIAAWHFAIDTFDIKIHAVEKLVIAYGSEIRYCPSEVSSVQCRPFARPWGYCLHGQYNKFLKDLSSMYKNVKRFFSFLLCSFYLQAMAHHGWSEYDQTNLVKFSGAVTQSGYEHPHGFITLSLGERTLTAVLAPPFRMENRGLTPASIAVGAQVVVEGYINRSKPNEIRAERIIVNGKAIELR